MADTPPPTPPGNVPAENSPQPNHAANSALRIMRQTERALSPWARRALQSSQPAVVQRSSQPAGRSHQGVGSLFSATRRPLAITNQTTLGLVNKAQRVSDQAGVMHLRPLARTGNGLQRMSSDVSAHFPDIARKYENRTKTAAPEAIQRSELSYTSSAGSSAAEPSGGSSAMPDIDTSESEATLNFSPDTSLTAIMATRLQAFRDASNSGAAGDVSASSPRQISRKAADVAARASQIQKAPMRRGSVEEIGSKAEDLARPTSEPSVSDSKPVVNESVQRKPAAPASPSRPTPSRAKPAPTQSYSEPAWMAQPDPYDIPQRPELPSITQELTQRYMAQRSAAAAMPKSTNPEDDLPSFLRKDSSGTPAFHLTARNAAPTDPSVQRKPESSAPARPTPAPTSSERPLVAPRQTAQRQAAPGQPSAPSTAEDSPVSESEPPAAAPSAPAVQRSPSSNPAAPSQPGSPSIQRSTAPKPAPSARPRGTIQRKPLVQATRNQPPVDRPLVTPPAASPTVQRSPEPGSPEPRSPEAPATAPATAPAPAEPKASVSPAPPTLQRSPISPSVPASSTELPLQRKPAEPLETPSAPTPPVTSSSAASASVQRQVAPASPPTIDSLSVVQRRAESPSSAPVTPTPSQVSRPVDPAPASPTPAPTIQRQAETLPLHPPSTSTPTPQFTPPASSLPAGPSLGQSVINRAQASTHLPLSQPSASIQRRVESAPTAATPVQPIIGRSGSSASTGPSIQRSAEPDLPTPAFSAPFVSPVHSALQRKLSAPSAPIALDLYERPSDSSTSARSTSSATGTLQRSPDIAEAVLPTPSLPLAVNRAPTSVQRAEVTGGDASTSTETQSEPAVSDTANNNGPDLQELARKIYPLLKRMLAIERERR